MVEDMRTALIEIDVPEQYINKVKIGGRIEAKTWAYSGITFTAKVIAISPAAMDSQELESERAMMTQEKGAVNILDTKKEKIVRVTAELLNSDGRLKPGMTGYAKIKSGWRSLGSVLISEVTRFFIVEVWSWLP